MSCWVWLPILLLKPHSGLVLSTQTHIDYMYQDVANLNLRLKEWPLHQGYNTILYPPHTHPFEGDDNSFPYYHLTWRDMLMPRPPIHFIIIQSRSTTQRHSPCLLAHDSIFCHCLCIFTYWWTPWIHPLIGEGVRSWDVCQCLARDWW